MPRDSKEAELDQPEPAEAASAAQACRICGVEGLVPYIDHGRRLYTRGINIPRDGSAASLFGCRHCGHKQFLPDLVSADLAEIYAEPYFCSAEEEAAHASFYEAGWNEVRQITWRLFLDAGVPDGARVHEFGCGSGVTVFGLRNLGYDVTGSDWSSGAIDFAHRQGNAHVFREDMNTPAAMAGTPLDVILSNDAIEHVPDPVEMLRGFAALAGPETRIVVRTNNGDGAVNRRLGMLFDLFYYFPHHIHYFSARSLVACANRAGLKPLLIRDPGNLSPQLRDAALGPLTPGQTEEERLAEAAARFETERLEAVFVRKDSSVRTAAPDLPAAWTSDTLDEFEWDSHADFFKPGPSVWRRQLVHSGTLVPWEDMFYEPVKENLFYWGSSFIGDHWMANYGNPPWLPLMSFEAPVSGKFLFDITLANRFENRGAVRISLIRPNRLEERFFIDRIAPLRLTRRFTLRAGQRVGFLAEASHPESQQKTTVLVGVRRA